MLQDFILIDFNYYVDLVSWLEQHMLPCGFKYFFGIDCPGCGLQRSIILLLEGNLWESILMYPPLLPIILILSLHFFNKKVQYNGQAILFKVLAWFVAGIAAANFFYKFFDKMIALI